MSKIRKIQALLYDIRHQLYPTISTWSHCANSDSCPGMARGGRACVDCLRLALIEEIGDMALVESFIESQRSTFALQRKIEEVAS